MWFFVIDSEIQMNALNKARRPRPPNEKGENRDTSLAPSVETR